MVSWWGGRGGQGLGHITRCHRAHDGTGAPATSWPPTSRATDGLKQVMSATGGLTTNPERWQVSGPSNRYRQKPAGTPGRTTKSSTFESLIALPPAGSAFFSLVFFAEAKKSDRRPPQGDVVFLWVQKPSQPKQTATTPASRAIAGARGAGFVVRPPVAEPLPIRQSAGTGAKRHDTSHRDGFVVGWARWSRSRAYQPGATAPTTEPVRLQLRGRPLRERQTA